MRALVAILGRLAWAWADEAAQPPPPLLSDTQKAEVLIQAERELMELQQLLGVMYKKGFKEEIEYKELVTLYAQLSRSITEAIRTSGLAASAALGSITAAVSSARGGGAAAKRNVKSINSHMPKFTSTMGPATLRGMVSKGPEVENLQQVLNWEKISVNIDGIYSPDTMVAVKALQKKYGVNPTGTVGADTRRLLNILIGVE